MTSAARSAARFVENAAARSVFVAALLLSLVVTWPLALHLTSAVYGQPGDAFGTISDFWWFDYALHHGRPLLYNELRGVPLGSGWQNAYFDVVQILLFAPLSYLIGAIGAYNLGILSSFPLTACVTFLLARRLEMTRLAAAFAGITFAFVPYHQEKAMVHLLHTHMELFAGFLYFAIGWRQSGSRWNIVGAAGMAGLALWTDPSVTYLMGVLVAVFFITSIAYRPPDVAWRRHVIGHVVALIGIGAGAALFIPAVVAVSTRSGAQHVGSLAGQLATSQRSYQELLAYSARLKEYILPWHFNPLVPSALRAYEQAGLHGSNFGEQTLTVGFTTIAMAAVGLILFRRSYAALLPAAIALVGFVMSQPPDRTVLGLSIPAPSHFLFALVPIFRAYARFGALVLFGAALLAGLGYVALQNRLGGSARWALAVPFLLIAVEFNGLPPSHVYFVYPAPAEYSWLKTQPAGTLIEYPIAVRSTDPAVGTRIEDDNRVYSLYQQVHQHAMFNGATPDSAAGQMAIDLEPYYAQGVSQQLISLHIRYVFVHRAEYRAFGRDPSQPLPGYELVTTLDDTDVYVAGGT